ncbi:hypothetical protein A1O1_01905 [Capronia coronata CBS 617.96]|uniref:Peptidase M43 pregnancy-associated plasma-A domain-containing protein n=1 Tax=Capronia coronata CBS 617.96 TaxID=1182541 RepID=W9YLT2_9EURO|nr:uncharacterized protein A1O1_01905 [Capronia coronata CBS 617.96]EXJ93513.1 hypothetical protein A1O1_01905 [Capronia coronata CBS 617.96]
MVSKRAPSIRTSILLLTLALTRSSHARVPKYKPISRSCGVASPSTELQDSHRWLQHNEALDNDLWNASSVQQRHIEHHHHGSHPFGESLSSSNASESDRRRQALPSPSPLYVVDTYIHIVADSSSASASSPKYVTDTMISQQFAYLAHAYTNASIGYRLLGISRSTNDTWAANGDDAGMKRALRRGTYSSLNIYYQSLLQAGANTPGIPAGSTLLGFCSLPAAGVTSGGTTGGGSISGGSTGVGNTTPGTGTPTPPNSRYILDGCNVLSGTMPGGNMVGYNLGGTTAHEVGHWNGLLHTFNGNSCAQDDFGDYVADTPQEMTSTNRCPVYKDSCPSSGVSSTTYNGGPGQTGANPYGPQGYSGPDPIHNFMDYSDDVCYQGFTPGQGARMLNIWQIYREGL